MFYVVKHYEDWSDNLQDYCDQVVFMSNNHEDCEHFIDNVDDVHDFDWDNTGGWENMYVVSYSIMSEVPGMLWTDNPYNGERIIEYDMAGSPLGSPITSYKYNHCFDETTAKIKAVIEAAE